MAAPDDGWSGDELESTGDDGENSGANAELNGERGLKNVCAAENGDQEIGDCVRGDVADGGEPGGGEAIS